MALEAVLLAVRRGLLVRGNQVALYVVQDSMCSARKHIEGHYLDMMKRAVELM